jgi:hypothetical protein
MNELGLEADRGERVVRERSEATSCTSSGAQAISQADTSR